MTTLPNKKQVRILTSFMEEHNDLAKSFSSNSEARSERNRLWDELKTNLNLFGPPVKTTAEWKRAWTLRKYRAKKKLNASNKFSKKTGEGQFLNDCLSENDKAIISVCGMKTTLSGTTSSNSLTVSDANEHIKSECIPLQQREDLNANHEASEVESNANEVSTRNSTKRKRYREDLLSKHVGLHEKFAAEDKDFKTKILKTLQELRDTIIDQNNSQNRFQEICLANQREFQQQALMIFGSLHDDIKSHLEENEGLNRELIEHKRIKIELKRLELEILKANNDVKLEINE